MSDSKKFGEHKEEEMTERVGRIESILPICVRVDEYRIGSKKIDDISSDLSNLSSQVFGVLQSLDELRSSFSGKYESQSKQISSHELGLDTLKKNVYEVDSKIASDEKIFSELSAEFSQFKQKLVALEEKVFKENVLEKLKEAVTILSSVAKEVNFLKSFQKEVEDNFHFHSGNLDRLRDGVLAHVDSMRDHWERMDVLSQGIESQKVFCQESIEGLKKAYAQLKSDVSFLVEQKIGLIKFPDPSPSEEEVKKMIASAMELISLDSKIAISRSANNEMKINLLEKKLEQIALVVKKLELS